MSIANVSSCGHGMFYMNIGISILPETKNQKEVNY